MFPYVKEVEISLSNVCVLSNLIVDTINQTITKPINSIIDYKNKPLVVTPVLMNCMTQSEDMLLKTYDHINTQGSDFEIKDANEEVFCRLIVKGNIKNFNDDVNKRFIDSLIDLPIQICTSLIKFIQSNILDSNERSRYEMSIYNITEPNPLYNTTSDICILHNRTNVARLILSCSDHDRNLAVKDTFASVIDQIVTRSTIDLFVFYVEYYNDLFNNILIQIKDTADQTYTHFVFMDSTWMINADDEEANKAIYKNQYYNKSISYVISVIKNHYLVQVRHPLDLKNHKVFTLHNKSYQDYSYRITMMNKYYSFRCLEMIARLVLSKNHKDEYHLYNKNDTMINRKTFPILFNIFAHNFVLYLLDMYMKQLDTALSVLQLKEEYKFSPRRLPITQSEINELPTRAISLKSIESDPTERLLSNRGTYTIDDFRRKLDERIKCADLIKKEIHEDQIDVFYDRLDENIPLQLNLLQLHFDHDDDTMINSKVTSKDLCIICFTLYRNIMSIPATSQYVNCYAYGWIHDFIEESLRSYKSGYTRFSTNAFMDINTDLYNGSNLTNACYIIANRVCEYIDNNEALFFKTYTIGTYLAYIREQLDQILQYTDKYLSDNSNNTLIKEAPYIPYKQSIEDFVAKVNYYGAPMNYQLHWYKIV